jgi:rhodanese-related sulfurtransferase
MSVKRVSPQDAKELVDNDGYVYVDVRSIPEFDAGHPVGAYNIPLLHMAPGGMKPNSDFLAVVEANFAKDTKLVLGCKAGGRSLRAAQGLLQEGYTQIVDQRAGFEGARDAFGQLQEPGWRPAGLDVAAQSEPGRNYEELARKAGKE